MDIEQLFQAIPGYDPVETGADCQFDMAAAELALAFWPECLRHVKGAKAGQPFELELWEQAIIANLFGWKRTDGTRRYRECLIYVPRKNGKTPLGAGIALYLLFSDREPGAEIYSAAADRDQAALVYQHAAGMIRQEPELRRRCTIYGGGAGQQKSIVLKDYSGSYRVLSSDAHTKHGLNVHGAIVDELHAHKSRELVDVLQTGTGARRQPLTIHLTTADYNRESICNEKYKYACSVRDGVFADAAFLPVIYEASIEDDWRDPAVWARVNPNLGISLEPEYLERECQRAQDVPAYENTFTRLHLNIVTEQAERWLPMDKWDECVGIVDAEALAGQSCFAGLDLASTQDMAALVLYFPEEHQVLPFFWCPRETARKRGERENMAYMAWAREGLLELTEGNVIDHTAIFQRIIEVAQKYHIVQLAYDRYGAEWLQTQMLEAEYDIVPFGQGYVSMSAPAKQLERLVLSGELQHGGHQTLKWNASNVSITLDPAGNIKPAKDKSAEKIDGIVALIMAIGVAMLGNDGTQSVYETRGLIVL